MRPNPALKLAPFGRWTSAMKPGSSGSLYDNAAFSRCLLDTMNEKSEISMSALETRYSADDIEARILAAIRVAGVDPDRCLSPVELAALGHFQSGGLRASRDRKSVV